MRLRFIRRNFKAVSPVIGTILVIFVILSTTATVMVWGIPYLDSLKAESQQASIAAQLSIIEDTIGDVLSDGIGSQRENIVSIEDGSFGVNKNDKRVVVSYSIDDNYDFALKKLDPFDGESYNPMDFELSMIENSANKIEVTWLNTTTPYSSFYGLNSTANEIDEPSLDLSIDYLFNDPTDDYGRCIAYYDTTHLFPPLNPSSFPNNMYSYDQRDNISSEDDEVGMGIMPENLWEGDSDHDGGKYSSLLYQFNITQPISNITYIIFNWKGYDTFSNPEGELNFYIYNSTVAEQTPADAWQKIRDTVTSETPINLNYEVPIENIGDYISNGKLYFAVSGGLGDFSNDDPEYGDHLPTGEVPTILNPILTLDVEDPNGDSMDVYFYDREGNPIGNEEEIPQTVVGSGPASVQWRDLNEGEECVWFAEIIDEYGGRTTTEEFVFNVGENSRPDITPESEQPPNEEPGVSLNPTLSIEVFDDDNDDLFVQFLETNGEDYAEIGDLIEINHAELVDNCGTASYEWAGLSPDADYMWAVRVTDSHEAQTISDTFVFTTESGGSPPDKPGTPRSPANGATDQPLFPILSITVNDIDDDLLTVTFQYREKDSGDNWAFFGASLLVDGNGPTEASCRGRIIDFKFDTWYEWRVQANDGTHDSLWSNVWEFQTVDEINPCCFPAGTKITMSDGNYKNIEDMQIGDDVLSYDIENLCFLNTKVTYLYGPDRLVYDINDGLICPTDDHPFFVKKPDGTMGWAAINIEHSHVMYDDRNAAQLEVGDQLFTEDGEWITIYDIASRPDVIKTYTLMVDSPVHDFFANGLLVSNHEHLVERCFLKGTKIVMKDDSLRPIEEICIGDVVKSYDFDTQSILTSKVVSIASPINAYYTINEDLLKVTDSHPLYVLKSDGTTCWAAINPNKAEAGYEISSVKQLEIGDRFLLINGEYSEPIYSIDFVDKYVQTYSLGLEGINNFYADGILAYGLPMESKHTLHEQFVKLTLEYTAEDNTNPTTTITRIDPYPGPGIAPPPVIETSANDITIYWEGDDDLTYPSDLRYKYKFSPTLETWNYTDDTQITFYDLVPGKYTFIIKAIDQLGNTESTKATNTKTITILGCNKVIDYGYDLIGPGQSRIINVGEGACGAEAIEGFIRIDIYENDHLFGQAYIFDLDTIHHSLNTGANSYDTLLQNGAILTHKSRSYSFYDKPTILNENNVFSFHVLQTIAKSGFAYGSQGKISVTSRLTKNEFLESEDVHNLKMEFFGDSASSWIDFMKRNYDFILFDEEDNILAHSEETVRLILSHSIIEVNMGVR